MKKTLLFALSVLSLGASAQINLGEEHAKTLNQKHMDKFRGVAPQKVNALKNQKRTRGSEWYAYIDAVADQDAVDGFFAPMWQDSLVLVRYSNGLFPADMTTYANIFDPTSTIFTNPDPNSLYTANQMVITPSNSYTVDSIRTFGAYTRRASKTNIVDTLRLTYTSSNIFFNGSNLATCNIYADANTYSNIQQDYFVDTAFSFMPNLDPAKVVMEGVGVQTKDIYLTNEGQTGDTTFSRYFDFAVNMPVSPNGLVLSAITFLSGDTYNLGDSTPMYNIFRPYSQSFVNAGGNEVFPKYYNGDFNESSNADYRAISYGPNSIGYNFYIGTIFSNGRDAQGAIFNSRNQYMDMEYKVTCNSCFTIGTNDVANFLNLVVHPNPASDVLAFDFKVAEAPKNISIDITNTVGQIVKHQDFSNTGSNATLKVNVVDLNAGLYIYTINADGKKYSNKVTIQ